MLEAVLRTVSRFRMILPGQRIAVACSGGPDSTALLLILHQLAPRLGCTLSVCHLNHRLRGEQSEADERFVGALAERLQLPLRIERVDASACAARSRSNLEGKARELRYHFFLSLVSEGQADRVAVGHTADDQAETVLHRFLRGAGTRGLAGIYPVVENRIIRPLIAVRRKDVLDWLTEHRQPWCEDASNLDLRFTRNRIRHQLLPMLREFNPRIVETLAGAAEIARDEEAFWQDYLPEVLSGTAHAVPGKVQIDVGRLRKLPVAAARRVLRWAVAGAAREPGTRAGAEAGLSLPGNVDFKHIQQLLQLADEGCSGKSLSLPGGIVARREFSHLTIQRRKAPPPSRNFAYSFRVPAKLDVPEIGISFCFEIVPISAERYNGKGKALLDQALGGSCLTLRNWQPGDGYTPQGHRKHRKLKELFRQNRIAISERPGWPVIVAEARVVWARCFGAAEDFLPRPGSTQAVLIEERQLVAEEE